MKNDIRNGTVLLKKLPYTRKKGLDAFGEFTVVGESGRSWLVTQFPTRGLEKAFKVSKKSLQAKGYYRTWDEVRNAINPKPVTQTITQRVAEVVDLDKLRRIEAILNEAMNPTPQRKTRTVRRTQPQQQLTPRKRAAQMRKRDDDGKFIPMKNTHNNVKPLH